MVPGEIAAGPGAVLDDDRLAERLLQIVGNLPREGVGGAAGDECHHEAHRPGGIRLCAGARRRDRNRGKAGCETQ